MAWDGSGNFSRTNGTNTGAETWQDDKTAGTKIKADLHDTHDQDLAEGIQACLAKNGENKMTGNLLPSTNNSRDLGSSSLKWRHQYLSGVQRLSKGADVASASALALGDDGNYFDITGTTTITSIASKGVGTVVKLHFDGALTLTHHATDLILPGGQNITTAAGDVAEFVEYASGDWLCVGFTPAATYPGGFPPGTRMLFQQTAAPVGWTKDTTHNDKALRIVSGTAGSGGSSPFSTVFGLTSTDGHTLTEAQLAAHGHDIRGCSNTGGSAVYWGHSGNEGFAGQTSTNDIWYTNTGDGTNAAIRDTGSDSPHAHDIDLQVEYVDVIIATKD